MKNKMKVLRDHFFSVCSICDELDVYEWEDTDEEISKMKKWVENNIDPLLKEEYHSTNH